MSTALIVIDAQESFRQHPLWATISNPDIVADISRLVEHARAAGDPVVWVLHAEPGSGGVFDPAGGAVRLQPGLEPRDDEPVVVKRSINAFTTTHLAQELTRHGVGRLRLAGIRTEQCVETTARVASDLGYEVEVVIDATATHPLALHDGSGELTPDEVIARTAAALSGRFATITTVAEVLAR
ncbi:isochorismatase family protein [Agrococcus sp. ARC_14]|uniref:isochorismatase family protein n=1 Tax=Agrococcus sp. ARC_14 TaxID=2919927 RepID=UPI001F05A181|nr:isochorismatase family protein [Agrococcus sp. ARC_14]MCH1884010.1 isochorismatase family protein [Agrococcus sp. ARC_14]